MKEKLYKSLPDFFQGLLISLFNFLAYRKRYGGSYMKYRALFHVNRSLSFLDLKKIQEKRLALFLKNASENSTWFRNLADGTSKDLSAFPIMKKEEVRSHIEQLYTVSKAEGIISKTGGTTGKSLEVRFTADNMQERYAMLDDFRNRFGYELGKKTAWFSGKDLLTARDIKKNRFWKTDLFYKVRYYSTFHIKKDYLRFYVEDLLEYQPEYLVGFPSTILEIAKYGLGNGYTYPKGRTKAIFPTAETVTVEMRTPIETFFQTKMYNQYASSEGAPFIFECAEGRLHLELQSGVFEVLDDANRPANSGRLILTSFTTDGTPLIRYDIGDTMSLGTADVVCTCGSSNPLVKEILGRIDDFIYSPENGKINLGNVSNTLKDTKGIIKFQTVQDHLNELDIFIIVEEKAYSTKVEAVFLRNWRDRVGTLMKIRLHYVEEIAVERSGKFRMVKNNIKDQIENL